MTIMPVSPMDRDFVIESFVEDWRLGRTTLFDADELLGQLRIAGDLYRLERLSQIVRGQH